MVPYPLKEWSPNRHLTYASKRPFCDSSKKLLGDTVCDMASGFPWHKPTSIPPFL